MAVTAQKPPALMTADEFLVSTVRYGAGKHQLIDGVIVAMAPASPTHGTIQANLAYVLNAHFEKTGRPRRVIIEAGIKPRVRGRTNVRVPDLLVTCGLPPQPGVGLVADPILVVEVLSPSNDDETEGALLSCATIPSVQEMLVVDSSRMTAEIWRRDASGVWPTEPETITAGGVQLDSIQGTFALADIYAGTHLIAS